MAEKYSAQKLKEMCCEFILQKLQILDSQEDLEIPIHEVDVKHVQGFLYGGGQLTNGGGIARERFATTGGT